MIKTLVYADLRNARFFKRDRKVNKVKRHRDSPVAHSEIISIILKIYSARDANCGTSVLSMYLGTRFKRILMPFECHAKSLRPLKSGHEGDTSLSAGQSRDRNRARAHQWPSGALRSVRGQLRGVPTDRLPTADQSRQSKWRWPPRWGGSSFFSCHAAYCHAAARRRIGNSNTSTRSSHRTSHKRTAVYRSGNTAEVSTQGLRIAQGGRRRI